MSLSGSSKRSASAADYTATLSASTMGYASLSASAAFTSAVDPADLLKSTGLHESLNPANFNIRESRNSVALPTSTPLAVFLDVTGSMGQLALQIAKNGLGTLFKEVHERKAIPDPHILFGGIGDVNHDDAPLQASQFEADVLVTLDQLLNLWVERGGGANSWESYNAPWHLCAFHTACDAFKDGRKGFLFTIGDEPTPPDFTADQLKKIYGREQEVVCTNKELIAKLQQNWHVFHVLVEQGNHMQHDAARVIASWRELLPQNLIMLSDHTKLAEVLVSVMQVISGEDKAKIAKSWGGGTDLVVAKAIEGVMTTTGGAGAGLVTF